METGHWERHRSPTMANGEYNSVSLFFILGAAMLPPSYTPEMLPPSYTPHFGSVKCDQLVSAPRHHAALIAAIVCRIWQDRTRIGPSVRQRPPRFSNISETEAWHDFRCRAEERKLLCPKPLRALRTPRRVVLRSGSTFRGETALRLLLRRMRKALLCL